MVPERCRSRLRPDDGRPTGLDSETADRTFLEGMIIHHERAITMPQMHLDVGFSKQNEVVLLAEKVVALQDGATAQMQGRLDDWYGAANTDHVTD